MGLLERTLKACMAQTGMPVMRRGRIVVADNHPRRLATAVVSRLQADSPVALRHIPAGERNIAHAATAALQRQGVVSSHRG
ncbi:glycosyltransferase family protein [Komagataeibacter saccharivorans]|uniref:hypothetical protein n=1 Tax=Komagataeibacter saccharivorans TaxID=265959 RepID=UPI000C83E9AC|nr:hypothetical protein [Komagataeibacter saccharivorans]